MSVILTNIVTTKKIIRVLLRFFKLWWHSKTFRLYKKTPFPADRLEKKVCHIIGSGWSAYHLTQNLAILDNAFVISFNQACVLPIKPDLYFIELANESSLSIRLNQLVQNMLYLNPKCLLVFKGVVSKKNKMSWITKNYSRIASFSFNLALRPYNKDQLRLVLKKILFNRSSIRYEHCSTLILCIAEAVRFGFKTIVLHGIDFGGPHFYKLPSYVKAYGDQVPEVAFSEHGLSHGTSSNEFGLQTCMPIIRDLCTVKGIKIMCGNQESPLSEYLEVFSDMETILAT